MRKLVRHGLPEPIPEGVLAHRTQDTGLIRQLLIDKLVEEAAEVRTAPTSWLLLDELADVYEVLHALATMNNYSMEAVEYRARQKADLRGSLLVTDGRGDTVGLIYDIPEAEGPS